MAVMKFRKPYLYVAIILVISLLKLYKINGGVILGEPDETMYVDLVRNLSKSVFPEYNGMGWYYGLPLYLYLGYALNFIFQNKLLTLRIISFLFSTILAVEIFFYLRNKISQFNAFLSALIFIIIPLSMFYSRIALIDMMLAALALTSIFVFDLGQSTSTRKLSVLSGLFLGLAILTKYTALPLMVGFCFLTLFNSKRIIYYLREKKVKNIVLDYYVINLISAALTVFPILLILALHGRGDFKLQTIHSLFGTYEISKASPSWFGIKDLMAALCLTSSLYFIHWAEKARNLKLSIVSGLLFGSVILLRSNLAFLIILTLGIFAVYKLWVDFQAKKLRTLREYLFHYLIINLAITLVFFGILTIKNGVSQVVSTIRSLFLGAFGNSGVLHISYDFFYNLPYWFSWPVLILLSLGFIYLYQKRSRYTVLILTFLVIFFLTFNRASIWVSRPRYLLIFTPFVAVIAGMGLELVTTKMRSFKYYSSCYLIIFLGFLLLTIPKTVIAFNSGYHTLVEDAVKYLDEQNKEDKFVLCSFWPNVFNEVSSGVHFTWLTDSVGDSRAWGPIPDNLDAISVLKKFGGYVLIEDKFTQDFFLEDASRFGVFTTVNSSSEFQELKVLRENSPNFPFTSATDNFIRVLKYTPK